MLTASRHLIRCRIPRWQLSSAQSSGIMSREEDHIVRPRDLNDRTYATWNLPVEQATIRSVMESDGGDPSTLKMVPYEVDDEVSGLKSKDV